MYDATSDLAFYHLCMMDAKSDKLSSLSESAFIGKMLPDVLTSMKEV